MNARYLKHVVATLTLTLAAGAAFAAFKHASIEAPRLPHAAECAEAAMNSVPRVVITARRDLADAAETSVPRIVVTAHRSQTAPLAAATR